MRQEFSLSRGSAMINFTMKFCKTPEDLLDSNGFKKVLSSYFEMIKNYDNHIYKYMISKDENSDEVLTNLIKTFKLLLVLEVEEIAEIKEKYGDFFTEKEIFIEFIEGLYTYWRKLERYTIVRNKRVGKGLQNVGFVEANNDFTNLILKTYREIEETVMGYKHRVYRQLIAGANAGIILNDVKWDCPSEYSYLEKIPFIESIILQPPFITYPKRNTRKGIFTESQRNPIIDTCLNEDNWFCYPAKVGELLAYVYFHKDFMSQGISLCNLFELAKEEEYMGKKPDMIYLYGAKDFNLDKQTHYYKDIENDMMIGYANYNEDIDYFGYMKKMLLTLHNLKMIENKHLPIHGAMVNITMKDGKNVNVVIVGDSGAGKSESLEAFRELSEEYIKDMKIIFDDMGVLKFKDNKIYGYGTEIGAFVRLDDLDTGYAYKEIDRSIFMNPDKINARVIIPVATYDDIMKGYPIDIILYANNYEDGEEIIFFESPKESIEIFKEGTRMAKGTTAETGLVNSYFANPFGPIQKQAETNILLDKYFHKMFEDSVKVGQIRTCLGIKGLEKNGPKKAAIKLFELIKKM